MAIHCESRAGVLSTVPGRAKNHLLLSFLTTSLIASCACALGANLTVLLQGSRAPSRLLSCHSSGVRGEKVVTKTVQTLQAPSRPPAWRGPRAGRSFVDPERLSGNATTAEQQASGPAGSAAMSAAARHPGWSARQQSEQTLRRVSVLPCIRIYTSHLLLAFRPSSLHLQPQH